MFYIFVDVFVVVLVKVDCSNRGLCNYQTGLCSCFNGYYGESCNTVNPTAVYTNWVQNPRDPYSLRNPVLNVNDDL